MMQIKECSIVVSVYTYQQFNGHGHCYGYFNNYTSGNHYQDLNF